jgi:CheY-like chemotaxis protein
MTLFERYVKQASARTTAAPALSFLAVSIELEPNENAGPVVDEYLQRSVRAHDLVIETSPRTWLVAASCPEPEVAIMIERLADGWRGYARNCPGGKLPDLQITHHGTHSFTAGPKRLNEEFQRLLESHARKQPAGGTVLVVDDDQEVNSCLGVRLQAAGYDVLSAFDGNEGLAAAIQHHPDAVVLDLRMPNKDGLAMLQEMRSNREVARTPVVVLSANIRDQHRALKAGANYFVAKPYEATAVLSAIQSSLSERSLA